MRTALWLALCAGCLYQSSFALLPLLISSEGASPYAERRIRNGFGGLRLDHVEGALDHRLPRSQAVALGPELAISDFLRQRFAEALFPRRIDPNAMYLLGKAGAPLAAIAPSKELLLAGPATRGLAVVPEPSEADASAAVTLARVLATLLAFGALGWWILPGPAEAILASATVAAVAQALATFLGIPLFPVIIPLAGIGSLALLLVLGRAHPVKRPNSDSLAFLALLAALSLIPLFFPSLKWDSRSIWLFHAKVVFFHGYLPRELAANASYAWTHFDYPPLFSAWMAAFSNGPSFSERAAQTALAALAAALALSLWRLSRARFGRQEGALLAVAITLGVSALTTSGLADAPLLLALLVARLAFQSKEIRLGFVALLAASLMKTEGLFLGALVLSFTAPRSRAWLAFLPAVAFIAWAKGAGIQTNADGIQWAQVAATAGPRLTLIGKGAFGYFSGSFFLAGGLAALLFAAIGAPRSATLLAALAFFFAFAVFVITPFDLAWHLSTAMERLLIHGAGFALLAACEASLAGRRIA
jgi:hypothetical protein